jgi:hypothetical protein
VKDFRSACDYISVTEIRTNETDDRTPPKPSRSMKQRHAFSTILATALVAAATLTNHAQSLQLLAPIPGFAPVGQGSYVFSDPTADPNHPVIFVGGGTTFRLTAADADFSAFSNIEEVDARGNRMDYNSADGMLYAAGMNNNGLWTVRKSPNGINWSDDGTPFSLSKNSSSSPEGLTTDGDGNVYVCGWAVFGKRHWIVRRKLRSEGVWKTVSDLKSNGDCYAREMCFFPGNGNSLTKAVFAVGHLNGQWTVMRSQNQGATWTSVDAVWSKANPDTITTDAACDSAGNIYVVGYHQDRSTASLNTGCVIRTSRDGGSSWATLLDQRGDPQTGAWFVAIAPAGGVTVTGFVASSPIPSATTFPRWTVIQCANPQDALSWQYSYANPVRPFGDTTLSRATGITADALGNVLTCGFLRDWTDSDGNFFPGDRVGLLRIVP